MRSAENALAAKQARVDALDIQVAEMERAGQHLSAAYKSALLELGELRGEAKHLRAAADELKSALDEARGARDAAQAQVKKLKGENRLLKLLLVVGGIAAVAVGR